MEGELEPSGAGPQVQPALSAGGGLSLGLAVWLLPLEPAWIPADDTLGGTAPAVLNYILCEQYQCQPDKVASIVLGGNALSIVVIPLAVWLALHLGS